ncbi:MAG: hypothetical protein RLZZ519_1961, partial [Bacteroidota bacterium]
MKHPITTLKQLRIPSLTILARTL